MASAPLNWISKIGGDVLQTTAQTISAAINELKTAVSGKQDALTFDNSPTNGSNNPVKSGGVYSALSTKLDASDFAAPFSPTATYSVGDYVSYEGSIYKFTAAHSGAWNVADVVAVSLNPEGGNFLATPETGWFLDSTSVAPHTQYNHSGFVKQSDGRILPNIYQITAGSITDSTNTAFARCTIIEWNPTTPGGSPSQTVIQIGPYIYETSVYSDTTAGGALPDITFTSSALSATSAIRVFSDRPEYVRLVSYSVVSAAGGYTCTIKLYKLGGITGTINIKVYFGDDF